MRYKKAIYMYIAIIIAGVVLYRFIGNTPQDNKITPQSQEQSILSSQTNSEGTVTVKATPKNISEDKKTWQFQIILDTHTGSLDEDLAKSSELENEEKIKLSPISWKGDQPGGHHRKGVLTFPAFQQTPKSVTLILRSVGEITERRFMW